jgi:hypothetical protein
MNKKIIVSLPPGASVSFDSTTERLIIEAEYDTQPSGSVTRQELISGYAAAIWEVAQENQGTAERSAVKTRYAKSQNLQSKKASETMGKLWQDYEDQIVQGVLALGASSCVAQAAGARTNYLVKS